MSIQVTNPFEVFIANDGKSLENGNVYIGQYGLNPEAYPIPIFYDADLTTPAAQPIKTLNGFLSQNRNPANIFTPGQYSITLKNNKNELMYTNLYAGIPEAYNPFLLAINYGDGSRTSATLNAAIQSIGAAVVRLLVTKGNWIISENVTFPNNITVQIEDGCTFLFDNDSILSFCGFDASPYNHIFYIYDNSSVIFNESYVMSITPELWGAKSDGVTESSIPINHAQNSMTSGSIVLSPGVYFCNSEIIGKNLVNIVGPGSNICSLDFSLAMGTFSKGYCIYYTGDLGNPLGEFRSHLNTGDNLITYETRIFDPQDWLIIYNTANGSFNPDRDYYRAGEFCTVSYVLSGGSTYLSDGIFGNYLASSTTDTYRPSAVKCTLSGFSINAKNGIGGIIVSIGRFCSFNDIKGANTNVSIIALDRCYECTIDNMVVSWYSEPLGLNYGLVLSNVQNITVNNSILETSRHGMTSGGGDISGGIPNRNVTVTNSLLNSLSDNTTVLGCDMHGNCERFIFSNNQLMAGINLGGDNHKIHGNFIRQMKNGYCLFGSELIGMNLDIKNNTFEVITEPSSPSTRAPLDFGGGGSFGTLLNASTFIFKNNRISSGDIVMNNGHLQIYLRNSSIDISVDIQQNEIISTGVVGSAIGGIQLRCDSGVYFKTIQINDNNIPEGSINLIQTNCESLNLYRNIINLSHSNGIFFTDNDAPHHTKISMFVVDNNINAPRSTGIIIGGTIGSDIILFFKRNLMINCAQSNTGSSSTNSSFLIVKIKTVFLDDNYFGDNQTVKTQDRLYALADIVNVYEGFNTNIDRENLSAVNIDFPATITNIYGKGMFTSNGISNMIAPSTSITAGAPTTGTWVNGDFIPEPNITINGSGRYISGYRCSVAGSPGTWVNEYVSDASWS